MIPGPFASPVKRLLAPCRFTALLGAACLFYCADFGACARTLASHASRPAGQSAGALTPLQRQIETERKRLSSPDVEERREAVTRLGGMGRDESSRAASVALTDRAGIVRATAARAVISLGPTDAATLLTPLLRDRDVFVRREAAYALGLTRSRVGVAALVATLEADKKPEVRGAAAVALGQIADPSAVAPLASKLSERRTGTGLLDRVLRRRREEDEFVRRSAAISLGQIGSREAVPALLDVLTNERSVADLRRQSARALGLIGDPAAIPVLRSVLAAPDPHLARVAFEALRRLETPAAPTTPAQKQNGR